MTCVTSRPVTGTVIAGMPIVHLVPDRVTLSDAFPDWTPSRVTDAPVRLRHQLAEPSTDGLRLLVDSPETREAFFLDARGELAVRLGPWRWGERSPQLLTTEVAGEEYRLAYARAEDANTMLWRWTRTVVTYALAARRRGVALHASGFRLPDGRGVLCPGVSGAGKSTLAAYVADELGPGAVLSDDRVVVTVEGGGLRVWGTPWHSSARLASPADAPAAVIVVPRHGAGGAVRRLRPGEALAPVLRAVAAPFWSAPLIDACLDLVDRLLREVALVEYTYSLGPGAARPLLRALAG